ncbi:MAG: PLP-dependent aminotransferase family protein [Elusimicrobiota bacterium]|jgi:2-aminoadipate transaminase|nr:PLP-dependent aminotransferase family protein [Elusimicrobiota bacterium]
MNDFSNLLASVTKRAKASVIRELLKYGSKPGLISFAGGMPDPTEFPCKDIAELTNKVLTTRPNVALQYGETEGQADFKQEIIKLIKEEENIDVAPDQLLITSASQQSLDFVSKAFIDVGDCIIVGKPTYLGALQAFVSYGADMIGVESDDYGITVESLAQQLENLKKQGKVCKFIYVVPDFQNPTGTTIPTERRKQILELAKQYGTLILEDSPYRKIRFEGKDETTFYALDKGEGNVITMFTFSKTFVPGFRLGYIIAHKDLIRKFVVLKQSMDLCTSPICQSVTSEFLKAGKLAPHVAKIVKVYSQKRDAMIKALETYMPSGVTWTHPQGGLFLWVVLPENIDAEKMLPTALEHSVAYVIGSAFYPDNSGHNTMRLNFSYASFKDIDEGIKRLAETIKNYKA